MRFNFHFSFFSVCVCFHFWIDTDFRNNNITLHVHISQLASYIPYYFKDTIKPNYVCNSALLDWNIHMYWPQISTLDPPQQHKINNQMPVLRHNPDELETNLRQLQHPLCQRNTLLQTMRGQICGKTHNLTCLLRTQRNPHDGCILRQLLLVCRVVVEELAYCFLCILFIDLLNQFH